MLFAEDADAVTMDMVILAGGRAQDDLVRRTQSVHKALVGLHGKPIVQRVYEALRASKYAGRIALVGPEELGQISELGSADLLMQEGDSPESNLFTVFARLLPDGRILIACCDTPLLTPASLDDFISRSAPEAAVNVPVIRYELFMRRFPRAMITPVQLKDGNWVVGDCGLIHSRAIPRLQRILPAAFKHGADAREIINLLGWSFAFKVKMKRVTLAELEERLCEAAELPIRLVRDCDPALAFDVDTAADYDYLQRWAVPSTSDLPPAESRV